MFLQQYFKLHWLLIGLLLSSGLLPWSASVEAKDYPKTVTRPSVLLSKISAKKSKSLRNLRVQAAPVNPVGEDSKPTPAAKPTLDSPVPVDTFVPRANEIHLLLKVGQRKVHVYRGQKLLNTYPVAVGKKGWETPVGNWNVTLMQRNPGWTNFKTGEVVPPGPDNPLGERWIGFWTDGKDEIGFHGTTNLASIGKAASHGCVRMSNKDVKILYRLVKVGTVVRVRA
jgi:lipoprotein-anchoring transpeptidase ErfK/SrfK